ncbi:hypothetical protein ABTY61_29475 [Kitasatospora sp. NPDC096128]|uniref:hypothetical protein n=1 Tax=Kitasatospora sp. NPDC096128 TaxID=3155547 RepID=UPI00331E5DFA
MTSFLTHRALVHDATVPLFRRHRALRTCLTLFAPYGFHATYHHLTVRARIPRLLLADPESLGRAVEELHEARTLWLARAEEYAAQRKVQKRSSRRPAPPVWWNLSWRGSAHLRGGHDPFLHPALSLPDYVRRQNALMDGAELPGCPACGEEGPAARVSTGHDRAELCRSCSRVLVPCPCGRPHTFEPAPPIGIGSIWRREHMTNNGGPNPHWPAHLGTARVERLVAHEVPRLPPS